MLEEKRLKQELEKAIQWIKNYVEKAGANGVVVGNSGGKDSATVIAMATEALGAKRVVSVAIPCHSISEDLEDARLVSETFGVPFLEVDMTDSYDRLEEQINQALTKHEKTNTISKEAKINVKPRLRMTTLYAIAQTLEYLVIGTGNLCERMVGYTTKWGDSGSDFNPIGEFTVQEVLAIGKMLGVPDKILQKAPSDGLGGLSDEEKMEITYQEIAEYIEVGSTSPEVMKKIEEKYRKTKHKRLPVPMYTVHRTNYLEEMN